MEPKSARSQTEAATVAKGAFVNLLGMVGKLLVPISIVVIGRLYGAETLGLFVIGAALMESGTNLTVSGVNDGVLLFATRALQDSKSKPEAVYSVLANGLLISLGISVLLMAVVWAGGDSLLRHYDSDADLPAVARIMVWSLPFRAITLVVIASTKAHLTMKWDAVLTGFTRPGTFMLVVVVGYLFSPDVTMLAWAYTGAWTIVGLAALVVFAGLYSYRALWTAVRRFELSKPMLRFAIPQNLNMAFSRFASDFDIVMLTVFQTPAAMIGFYKFGAEMVRNIRQVKLIFSGAYAPVIVRLHAQGNLEQMNTSFSMVSRWTTTLALPLTIVVLFFRGELVGLAADSFTGDTTFMLWLAVPPLLSCAVGISSNLIVMTGHARWNLLNALLSGLLNGALNYLLIPEYGLAGAAFATATSTLIVSSITLLEARLLLGVTWMLSQVYKPLLAGLCAAVVAAAWSLWRPEQDVASHAIGCTLSLATYFSVLLTLGVPEEDRRALMPWRRKPAADPA